MENKARMTVSRDFKIGKAEDRLYGSFLEPIGNIVYGGVFRPSHPTADDMGFRGDTLELMKELNMSAVRLPAGNLISGYDWTDSIGPVDQRRVRLELAWRAIETNRMGLHEYVEWCRRCNTEPMYTINLATKGIEDAINCIEYCNIPGGTYWSDLRISHGAKDPYNIKTWYLGNEMDGPWQIAAKEAHEYGRIAHEASKVMKRVDPTIETVAVGSSTPLLPTYPAWDVEVLEQCYDTVDMLTLHEYHNAPKGNIDEYLVGSRIFDNFINTVVAACDYVKGKKRSPKKMMISFDEYASNMTNREFEPSWGRGGFIPFETHGETRPEFMNRPFQINDPDRIDDTRYTDPTMLDAVALGGLLLTFMKHADRIKIACLSIIVGSVISYSNNTVWRNTKYYPYLHASLYGRGTVLTPAVTGPTHNTTGFYITAFDQCAPQENVPYVDSVAVWNEDEDTLTIFAINNHPETDMEFDIDVRDFEGYKVVEHLVMANDDPYACNSEENPHNVVPVACSGTKVEGGKISTNLKKLSWNVIRLAK